MKKIDMLFKKLTKEAKLPTKAHKWDAGWDLYTTKRWVLEPLGRVTLPTGISVNIPQGYVGLIKDRSGFAHNHGLTVLGGVIDSGYEGEVKVILFNSSRNRIEIQKYTKIAQLLIVKLFDDTSIFEQILDNKKRGDKGFGSSGYT